MLILKFQVYQQQLLVEIYPATIQTQLLLRFKEMQCLLPLHQVVKHCNGMAVHGFLVLFLTEVLVAVGWFISSTIKTLLEFLQLLDFQLRQLPYRNLEEIMILVLDQSLQEI